MGVEGRTVGVAAAEVVMGGRGRGGVGWRSGRGADRSQLGNRTFEGWPIGRVSVNIAK